MGATRPVNESTTTVFNEWYGPLTRHQWKAYRRWNVSPHDHDDGWQLTGRDGDTIADWVTACGHLDITAWAGSGVDFAITWHRAGWTTEATVDAVSELAYRFRTPGPYRHQLRPSDGPTEPADVCSARARRVGPRLDREPRERRTLGVV